MKSKKRISLLAVLICVFALVFALGLMSACGNTDNTTASGNWFYGTEAPADGLGNNGDFYLNTETLTAYAKSEDGTWTPTTLYSGKGAPSNDAGEKGDLYLDLENKILYQKGESLWEIALKLQGEKGRDGVLWFSGDKDPDEYPKDDPAVKGAMKGDFYLKKGEFTIWQLDSTNTWVKLGTIKGDKGDNATQFYDGKGAPTEKNPENPKEGDLYVGTFDGFDGNGAGSRLYRYQDGKWNILMDTVKTNEVNIYNLAELQKFATAVAASQDGYVGKTVHLKADIDFNEPAAASMRKNAPRAVTWTPIGTENNPFRGTFDGEGHTIKNFTTTASEDATKVGFFGNISGATIEHLHFENVTIEASEAGSGFIGAAVVGQASGAVSFLDVTVTGNVEVQESGNAAKVGGLVGAVTEEGSVTVQEVEVSVSGLEHTDSGSEGGTLVGSGSGSVTFEGENEVSYSISEGFAETHHKSNSETTIIYEIFNLDGLKYFRDSVNGTLESGEANDYAGKTVVLAADIDLDNKPWTPIGNWTSSASHSFRGNFDGRSHKISNLKIIKDHGNTENSFGLFGNFGGNPIDGKNFVLQNLTIENVEMPGTAKSTDPGAHGNQSNLNDTGAFIGKSDDVDLKNLTLIGDVYIGGTNCIGSIVGLFDTHSDTVVENIKVDVNTGSLLYGTGMFGGIFGKLQAQNASTTIKMSHLTVNNVTVKSLSQAGCVVGVVSILLTTTLTMDDIHFNDAKLIPYNVDGSAKPNQFGVVAGTIPTANTTATISNVKGNVSVELDPTHSNKTKANMHYNGLVGLTTNNSTAPTITGENTLVISWYGLPYSLKENAWTVSNADELMALATLTNGGMTFEGKTIILADDIDLSEIENWTPIGTQTNPFKGTFDGKNFTISDLTINTTTGYAGLFGNAKNVVLKNVAINGATVTVHNDTAVTTFIGIFIACCDNDNSSISNVKIYNAKVQGTSAQYVGAIAGWMAGPISDCYAELTVTASTNGSHGQVGGIVGQAYGDISCCYAQVDLSGSSIGGIVGYFHCKNTSVGTPAITISNCYATGKINASKYGDTCPTYSGGIIACTFSKNIKIVNNFFDGTLSEYANPFIGASSGDDGAELEELTTDVFEKNSWNESLGATQKVQGYQGQIQIESLARSDECSFTAGMNYDAFLKELNKLNG